MNTTLTRDLRDLIHQRRILVIVGTGVSRGATRNAPASSWAGLLKFGVRRCRELSPALDEAWEARLSGQAESTDLPY